VTDTGVPEWLNQYIRAWIDRLALGGWTIRVSLSLCVNDDPATEGLCQQYPDINRIDLTFRADIEDTPRWRKVVIHEMLHARHARIDHLVERGIIPEVGPLTEQFARTTYHQQVESFVAYMTNTLYQATCALDYPGEHDKEYRDGQAHI
jgi:hypothetical protein